MYCAMTDSVVRPRSEISRLRLYRKFGFEVEGTLREYALRNGLYVDAYTMARLRKATKTARK